MLQPYIVGAISTSGEMVTDTVQAASRSHAIILAETRFPHSEGYHAHRVVAASLF